MKLPNGIDTENRLVIGVDWSRDKCDVFDSNTRKVRQFRNLEAVSEAYPNSFLVLETTAESYELQRRQKVLEIFKQHNIIAYGFPTDRTAKFRIANEIPKTDAGDAEVIYRITMETRLALHAFESLREHDKLRMEIEKQIITDRYLFDGEKSYATAQKYLKGIEVPEQYQEFVFSRKKYRKQIGRLLLAAEAVRNVNRGYREFRRLIGNYSNGYGQILRSEYYWWWVRTILNARLKHANIKKEYKNLPEAKTGKVIKIRQWSEQEKQLRSRVMREAVKAAQYLWYLTKKEI